MCRALITYIFPVISHLTCASLTEDQYGVVQRDIPRILETFLSFLSAIEEYRVQVHSLDVPPPRPDEQREGDGEGEGGGDGVREAAGNVRLTPKEWAERMRLHYEVEQSKDVLDAMGVGTSLMIQQADRCLIHGPSCFTSASLHRDFFSPSVPSFQF